MSQEKRAQQCLLGVSEFDTYGYHLYDPTSGYGRGGSTEYRNSLEHALPDLVEGGYVIDKRPLANHPEFVAWVFDQPLPNGDLDSGDLPHLDSDTPIEWLGVASAAYITEYWRRKGARIGKREGAVLIWEDGERQEILQREETRTR